MIPVAQLSPLESARKILSDLKAEANKAWALTVRRTDLMRVIAMKAAAERRIKATQGSVANLSDMIDRGPWPTEEALGAMRDAVADLRSAQERLEYEFAAQARKIADAKGDQRQIETSDSCPCCGASGEGWKAVRTVELRQIVSSGEFRLSELTIAVRTAQEARKTAERVLLSAQGEITRKTGLERLRLGLSGDLSAMREAFRAIDLAEVELAALPPQPSINADELTAARETVDRLERESET